MQLDEFVNSHVINNFKTVLSDVISLSKAGLIAIYPCSSNILAWASIALCSLAKLRNIFDNHLT